MTASPLRIAGIGRGSRARFEFDEVTIEAHEGEMLATALLAAGVRTLRRSPAADTPRGLFCAMGSCQECVVLIEGRRVEACRVPVRDGMQVRSVP